MPRPPGFGGIRCLRRAVRGSHGSIAPVIAGEVEAVGDGGGMDVDLWATYLAAWLKEQRADRDTAVLDLNREMMIRNALPLMAPVQAGWWENATAQGEVWKAQG